METFKDRLINENQNLNDKMANLAIFINGAKFEELDNLNKALLRVQYDAMSTYASILEERLSILT